VTVKGGEDIMVAQSSDSPYTEATEEALDCSFRSFEITEVMSEKGCKPKFRGFDSSKKTDTRTGLV